MSLDLQGGIQVTLEVSPAGVVAALTGVHATEPAFGKALKQASAMARKSTRAFTGLFAEAHKFMANEFRFQTKSDLVIKA